METRIKELHEEISSSLQIPLQAHMEQFNLAIEELKADLYVAPSSDTKISR
jgi:hypothetical protein